ncbi:emp24/gp25L/p24 family/GOLD-domain-containing protein [Russula emetica]|nr:emp24/gp25L/p24 family/GOLD-domain-containing protein [Russula emetica]
MLDFRARSLLSCLFLFISAVDALHFYLDANEKRCFIEELPTDTVVEGHYRAMEWSEQGNVYSINEQLGILVEVTEVESGHEVVSTRGPPDGRFTFTSHDAGDHSICLSTNYSSSWFGPIAHIRLYLDIVVGSTKPNADHDRSHVSVLASRLRDLNIKIEDIRREQQYQREREADFRNLSETTNSRAVWYSIAQIAVLLSTCAWQLRHLRRFFEDRKMR